MSAFSIGGFSMFEEPPRMPLTEVEWRCRLLTVCFSERNCVDGAAPRRRSAQVFRSAHPSVRRALDRMPGCYLPPLES
jgi:hypothetical protein